MSLRDQLLSKGLASKKDARRVERELEAEKRVAQGTRKSRAEIEAEERTTRAAEEAARLETQRADREAHATRQAAIERDLRIGNLLRDNRQRPGKGQAFWHRAFGGAADLVRLDVSSGIAYQLRNGEAGIGAMLRKEGVEYVILPRRAALKLQELAPEHLVFFVDDPTGISAPELAFRERAWDPDLAAHRATPADLDRFRVPTDR